MERASLLPFLATGRLGPITAEMTRDEVETLLGQPDDIGKPDLQDDRGESTYWMYGGHLEVFFRSQPPYAIAWFFIRLPSRDAPAGMGKRMLLEMDGLDRRSPPSAVIRMLAAARSIIEVQFDTDMDLRLFVGNRIEMLFTTDRRPPQADVSPPASLGRLVKEFEASSRIDSVYCFPRPEGRRERFRMRSVYGGRTHTMSGSEYLRLTNSEA